MKKCAVFFDIDGTLWDFRNFIPDSTRNSIRELRKNGHYAFINTGRCTGYVRSGELLSIGFDGIVAGCGTYVSLGDEVLYYHRIGKELAVQSVETVRRYGFRPILEGRYNIYMDDAEFDGDAYGDKLKRDLGEHLLQISEHWGEWEISKFSCATKPGRMAECFNEMGLNYDFMVHNSTVTEFVPKGHNKGTGMEMVCRKLGVDMADSFAFGDSPNDEHMLKSAGHAIVMGGGNEQTKKLAEFVTAGIYEGGIQKGLEEYGLI